MPNKHALVERAKRAHFLFMSIEISDMYIYIYVRVIRLYIFPYTPEALYLIYSIHGNFNVRGSLRFYS